MRKKTMSLVEVKDSIKNLQGKLIDIKINKGRKKIVKCVGEVIDIYPSVFTMKIVGDESNLMSCSYNDVICGMVSLTSKPYSSKATL